MEDLVSKHMRIRSDQSKWLARLAFDRGVSESDIIRLMIDRAMKESKSKRPAELAEAPA
jgi:hypothetical protein